MSSVESTERSIHSDSDRTATACAEAGTKAEKCFSKGNANQKKFGKAVVKRLMKLPADQKNFCIGMFSYVHDRSNLDRLISDFEQKEREAQERCSKIARNNLILVEWGAFYSKDNDNSQHHHRVKFCM